MRNGRFLVALLMTGLSAALIPTAVRAGDIARPDDVRKVLADYVKVHPFAGIAVGVIDGKNDATYFESGPKLRTKVTRDSIFQIGSVTKTFTATVLASEALAGQVLLDDPISKYLPPGVKGPASEDKPITLLSLAEQNSGLPNLPANLDTESDNPYATYDDAKLWSFLSGYTLTRAPGIRFEYSNLGVGLLGELLARAAHSTYADLVRTRIFDELRMNQSEVNGTSESRKGLVPGFTAEGAPSVAWDFKAMSGEGAIESSLRDMQQYLRANMVKPNTPLGKAMALAQEPRFPIESSGTVRIGLIWLTNAHTHITFHNGETGGYHAFVGFDNANHGVVLLANVADRDLDRIALHILVPGYAAFTVMEPSPYSGVYPLTPTFAISIYKTGGTLFERATGQPALPLKLVSGQTYAVEGVEAQITFELDAKGYATGLTLHQNGADQHAPKKE